MAFDDCRLNFIKLSWITRIFLHLGLKLLLELGEEFPLVSILNTVVMMLELSWLHEILLTIHLIYVFKVTLLLNLIDVHLWQLDLSLQVLWKSWQRGEEVRNCISPWQSKANVSLRKASMPLNDLLIFLDIQLLLLVKHYLII